jgi:tetratricopeptide (TPR) repeat protein
LRTAWRWRYARHVEIDPNNSVVRLCVEGVSAEIAGRVSEARALYERAWGARRDDYEACIAAHYVARVQEAPEEVLRWNRESLLHADLVSDERVRTFYPSLHLNMGKAYEELGNKEEARKFYTLAAENAGILPEGKYADMVRRGAAEGLERVA